MPHEEEDANVEASTKLLGAIKTIIVADLVMSIDNVIGIAGAAQQAAEGHQTLLIIFGLLVSVPFIIFGSQVILKLFDRFPIIVTFGGALLGWIGGGLIVGDVLLADHLPASDMVHHVAAAVGAILVIGLAEVVKRRRVTNK